MRSHRIAGVPAISASPGPPRSAIGTTNNLANSVASRQVSLPQHRRSNLHRSSSYNSRTGRHFDVNTPTSANGSQIIRVTCGLIFQSLHDASELLDGDELQHLCAEILVFSEETIKTKCNVASSPDNKSSPRIERNEDDQSLVGSIERRMAKVVEKEVIPNHPGDIHLSTLFPTKHALDLLAKLPNDEGQYDIFLNIRDHSDLMIDEQQIRMDYHSFKRSDSNVPFMIFFFVCGAFFMGNGYVWSNDVHIYQQYPTAILSILFGILASLCLLWITLNRVIFLSFQYNIVRLQRYHEFVVNVLHSSYGQWLDNGTILFASLSTGFYLINIALMDLCDPEVDVNVGLNHHVACGSFVEPPPESFVLTMIIIIVLQLVARGVGHMTLVCSWIICIVAVNASITLARSGNYVWMNLLLLFCLCISYEFERHSLRQYIKTRKAIVDGEVAAELRQQLATYEILQASQALESKRSMVRHISHEIRTPLNVVGIGVEMLIRDLESHASLLPDGVMDTVHGIQDASNESLEVINELLEFEKLAAGLTTLECVPIPLLSFLEQAMKKHLLPARTKNIMFELVPSSMITPTMTINVDPMKLIIVFRNLFSNAIKFSKEEGRVTVRIDIKHPSLGNEVVEISVQDTGAGLSAANLGRLFGEGVQFNANGLQGGGGSGLGLFNTKGIVDLHENGKIWAESEGEGKGCTFFVQLPLHSLHDVKTTREKRGSILDDLHPSVRNLLSEESNVEQSKGAIVSRGSPSPISLGVPDPMSLIAPSWMPTILVVDDSVMNRKMLVRILISYGFACREAEDGLEALSEMFGKNCFASLNPSPFLDQRRGSSSRSRNYSNNSVSLNMHNQKQPFSIDAVLIDFHMPRMNGPDTIVEMLKMGFRGPIIGVSGGDKKMMKQFVKAGANNVIQKPAQSKQLIELLLNEFRLVIQKETVDEPTPLNAIPQLSLTPSQERVIRLRTFLEKKEAVGK